MVCPRCHSENVKIEAVQEMMGSTTVSNTKSKYKQQGHGCLWWICIGSWWWIVDLFLWICFFIPRLLIQVFKKKKYKGKSVTTSVTTNNIRYKTICICQNCANRWEA